MAEQPGATQQVADQAREQVQQGAQQAKGALRNQVDQRSTQAGQQISTQASDIRTVADQLREQGKEGPAKVAEQAAQRAEKLGSYFEQSDADRILGDVEDYARNNPWVVAAGGLAAGFLLSRFVKASTQQRQSSLGAGTAGGYVPPSTGYVPPSTPTPRTAPPTVPVTGGTGTMDGIAPTAHPSAPATGGLPTGAGGRIG
jgi:ElaB/YqjD/DUF883 family membrane-anchored ribosome-binding protein